MAFMKQALSEADIKKLTVSGVKKAYNALAKDYNKLIEQDVVLCPKCNEFKARNNFYQNKNYEAGFFPICKECLLKMATDKNKDGTYKDNKKKAKKTLMLMDLPFLEAVYDTALIDVTNAVAEKNRATAWSQYLVMIQSLPQYRGLHWENSEFKENSEFDDSYEVKENQAMIKRAKKRFGIGGYSNEEYMFLEREYQDWVSRYECENKTQETIFERLSCKKLEIMKATRNGQPTKDLDKTYTELLSSANLLPRQNVGNATTDSLTFGQLIEKWEQEDPIPEASEEFKDVDGIVKYIDVFFKGHLAKMMGLKNGYSHQYDEYMKQYTVTKSEYNEEEGSEAIFDALFGKEVE